MTIFTRQEDKFEALYDIPSGDSFFTCFTIQCVEEQLMLYIGTNFGQLVSYELTLVSPNFLGSQILNKANIVTMAKADYGIYI